MLKICSEYTVEDIVEHPLTIKKNKLDYLLYNIQGVHVNAKQSVRLSLSVNGLLTS